MSQQCMIEASASQCEVKIDGTWVAVGLQDAHAKHGDALKRCPICHGQVAVTGSYGMTVKLTLTHRRHHPGCPLIPKAYCGTISAHPETIA